MGNIFEPCKECGNEYYFTVYGTKVVCDMCLAKNKITEVKEKEGEKR